MTNPRRRSPFVALLGVLVLGVPALAGEREVTAEDRAFWSYRELRSPELPGLAQSPRPDWPRTAVDAFILARLESAGMAPSPPARRLQLIRRAYHDLVGLPPTPEAVRRFVADDAPDAWERLVDELLASSHYGERWGRHWLDVARYADSGGYEFDVERPTAWPYRDFVVDAFNRDLPFDEFVRLQLAGDEIAPDDPWARAATGFLTAGPTISNQVTEQNRYDELDDILGTTSLAVLGLTVGCARCHDHKFDAIPAVDYYRMLAAFTTTSRREAPMVTAKQVEEHERALTMHRAELAAAQGELNSWLASRRRTIRRDRVAALPIDEAAKDLLAAERDPLRPRWRYTLEEPESSWQRSDFDDSGWSEGTGGFGTRHTPGSAVGTEWSSRAIWLRREFEWNEGRPDELTFVAHHDDDVEIYLNGTLAARAGGYTVDYIELAATEEGRQVLRPGRNLLAVHCRQDFGGQYIDVLPVRRSHLEGSTPRRVALETPYTELVARYGKQLEITDEKLRELLPPAEREEWRAHVERVRSIERSAPRRPQRALCMTDASPEPARSWLLARGNPAQKQEPVDPGYLQVLSPADAGDDYFRPEPPAGARTTHRRRAFGEWLTDVERGAGRLTARVIVNRLWQHHFGEGLVRTPNDFGTQGDRPSHPQLLDWLAAELVAGGWRLKPLHRLIMRSAVYRQTTQGDAERAARDPDVRLHWRRRPIRVSAETLRDSILTVSGSLNRMLGGPVVKPWIHPDAIATGSTDKWPKNVRDGPRTWRRSLYIFSRRSVRVPMLEVFDAPDATASCGRRVTTTTPTQALALLNNDFVRSQARRLVARLDREYGPAVEDHVAGAFLLALGREPDAHERRLARQFLAAQTERYRERPGEAAPEQSARVDFCQVMFNLNEFLYSD